MSNGEKVKELISQESAVGGPFTTTSWMNILCSWEDTGLTEKYIKNLSSAI